MVVVLNLRALANASKIKHPLGSLTRCLTNFFAEPLRDAIGGGIAWIPSTGKIGGPRTFCIYRMRYMKNIENS